MTRANAITIVERLYSPDSSDPELSEIGAQLLQEVVEQFDWRELPDLILFAFAASCHRHHESFNEPHF